MAAVIMYTGNTQTLSATLIDATTLDPAVSATVTCTLKDSSKASVDGCTDLVMTETNPGVSGVYNVVINAAVFRPTPGTGYNLYITGSQPGGTVLAKQAIEVQDLLAQ